MSLTAFAHEFWLDPVTPFAIAGGKAFVDIKNGENFVGAAYPFNPASVKSIRIASEHDIRGYVGRLGDYPAIQTTLSSEGIHGIALETTAQSLTYTSTDKFTGFLEYHGFDEVLDRLLALNENDSDINENYTRSAKSFVQVAPLTSQRERNISNSELESHAAFEPFGHTFEMILLESPFSENADIPIKLLYQGAPLEARQVELFWSGDKTRRQIAFTDEDGIVVFNLPGEGDYLLNAVHIKEPDSNTKNWESRWASITFKRREAKP